MGFEDKTGNKMDDLGGKAKEGVGKATGNDELESEGKTDQAKSSVKEGAREVKEGLEGVKDSVTGDDDKK
ncbi:MAG TPA: CsbD family protein [Nocardioides sp.]|nr:CsbD family protein [Nocardioides sp.]